MPVVVSTDILKKQVYMNFMKLFYIGMCYFGKPDSMFLIKDNIRPYVAQDERAVLSVSTTPINSLVYQVGLESSDFFSLLFSMMNRYLCIYM